ncbi:hypothetical protein [Pseudomonas fluorescens]|uniref:hypothetical protein n=1 Tax=Pseudomonas fluorescens TaxID=294 RepID=UPI002034FBB1|nr:hypothetical protein [Pseudomonas fluorescens]
MPLLQLQRDAALSPMGSPSLNPKPFYNLYADGGCLHSALYRVIPAGKNFFHILEVPSGRIKGFRSDHNQACALAKELEVTLYALNANVVVSSHR